MGAKCMIIICHGWVLNIWKSKWLDENSNVSENNQFNYVSLNVNNLVIFWIF